MTIEEKVLEKLRELPPQNQKEVLRFAMSFMPMGRRRRQASP